MEFSDPSGSGLGVFRFQGLGVRACACVWLHAAVLGR